MDTYENVIPIMRNNKLIKEVHRFRYLKHTIKHWQCTSGECYTVDDNYETLFMNRESAKRYIRGELGE